MNSQEGRFYYQLLAIIDELRKYGIQSSDYVNYKNLGYKSNGNLGFFDIGFGDTNPNYEPEKLNIHERKISYMPNSKTVEVKQKCKLGGNADGTSEPCNQGDINNLDLKSINESKSNYKSVKESIERSRKIPNEMKEKIFEYVCMQLREKLFYFPQ